MARNGQRSNRCRLYGQCPTGLIFHRSSGADVKDQFENDLRLEIRGPEIYNQGIEVCIRVKDAGSREQLEHILLLPEEHVSWLEAQLNLIKIMGLDNYLTDQISS